MVVWIHKQTVLTGGQVAREPQQVGVLLKVQKRFLKRVVSHAGRTNRERGNEFHISAPGSPRVLKGQGCFTPSHQALNPSPFTLFGGGFPY